MTELKTFFNIEIGVFRKSCILPFIMAEHPTCYTVFVISYIAEYPIYQNNTRSPS